MSKEKIKITPVHHNFLNNTTSNNINSKKGYFKEADSVSFKSSDSERFNACKKYNLFLFEHSYKSVLNTHKSSKPPLGLRIASLLAPEDEDIKRLKQQRQNSKELLNLYKVSFEEMKKAENLIHILEIWARVQEKAQQHSNGNKFIRNMLNNEDIDANLKLKYIDSQRLAQIRNAGLYVSEKNIAALKKTPNQRKQFLITARYYEIILQYLDKVLENCPNPALPIYGNVLTTMKGVLTHFETYLKLAGAKDDIGVEVDVTPEELYEKFNPHRPFMN